MSKPKKNVFDLYLAKVFENFIALKDNDIKLSQEVFKSVFEQVKEKMGKHCNYFQKYSSQTMYAGSVYDGIKVSKLDEFDMDVVIKLPINYDEVTIENEEPGFVKMKVDKAFDNLVRQSNWDNCHRVTFDWRDSDKYFLQNKFRYWIQSIVQKAVGELGNKVTVNGVTYTLTYTQSGPAFTLKVRNEPQDQPFVLDVDLVPVIKFTHPRWPEGYREPNAGSELKDWLVVPKPNKAIKDLQLQNRCWRLSFQDFEKEMMKGCQNLKTTIRLVKKLRDGLKMKPIASYYIKTLFLWKITEHTKKYWETKLSVLFKTMVQELHDAIKEKKIRYFWNEKHNLIGGLKDTHRDLFVSQLKNVLDGIENNDIDKVLPALLSQDELAQFKKLDVYQKRSNNIVMNKQTPKAGVERELVITLISKIDALTKKVDIISEEMGKMNVGNAFKEEFLSIVGDVGEISEEIEDMGFDEYNPKRIKKWDGSKVSPLPQPDKHAAGSSQPDKHGAGSSQPDKHGAGSSS